MSKLYEQCPMCRAGEAEPEMRLADGNCPGCGGRKFVEVGLTARQLERLTEALDESVKLQSHYAELLNQCDGGRRMTFISGAHWMSRLRFLRDTDASRHGKG